MHKSRRMSFMILICMCMFVDAFLILNNHTLDEGNVIPEQAGPPQLVNEASQALYADSKRLRSKDTFPHNWYSGPSPLDMDMRYCQRPAKCQLLNRTTCMGSKLPYHFTSLDISNMSSQDKVYEILQLFQHVRFIPKCWTVIQPFLCAVYMPKCENDLVDLPSREMCRITRNPCKILYDTGILPEFINCDNDHLFPSKCKNDIHEVKFNTAGSCIEPLVHIDHPNYFVPGVDGCSIQCRDVLYTDVERGQINKLLVYCVNFCIVLNLFAVVTFFIDWKGSNKYPTKAVFYINLCFFISHCGWLMQFLSAETKDDIVCKKDGTLRKHEPSANENLSCVSVFVMVYYFLIAGMVWFVIFTYVWYMSSLRGLGKIQDRIDRKRAYFHITAWCLPLIFTITTMGLGEIDGDYVLGICFVGFINPAARIGLLLAPLGVTIIVAGCIICLGLHRLIRVRIDGRNVISPHASKKIKWNVVRMGTFAVLMLVFCAITIFYHVYSFRNANLWSQSLQNYVLCKLTSLSGDFSHCKKNARPSVAMLQLQLLAVFGSGIAMSSWVWSVATIHAWRRFVRKKANCEVYEPTKFQKHKIIAQAYEKRKKYNEGHKISFECQRTDLLGLDFDVDSAATNEVSTTWVANVPRFVHRRAAIIEELFCSGSSNSEMSYSLQQISIESRRNSGESQLSVQVSEFTAKFNAPFESRRNSEESQVSLQVSEVKAKINRKRARRKRGAARSGRRNSRRSRHMKTGRKHGSTTSSDSQADSQLLSILSAADSKNVHPNLAERRKANAGLDEHGLTKLLANAKLMLPYDDNIDSSKTDVDDDNDENVSVTISESKFNVIVNNNLDLGDRLFMKSLRIKELTPSGDHVVIDRREESNYDTGTESDSSSTPELKQLLQSSLNSGDSTATQNRASKQSKNSADVAVQANAKEIASQTAALQNSKRRSYIDKCKKKRKYNRNKNMQE